ncbi:hypothetical protein HK100_008260 [Physocladia obscura]|uniref:Uncharacterized protein n=1 Tax=Physocladia obscura TaxID=109957 RepID=A0AAD5XLH3_9FUNG|nr:hypothetical protein HK100_008260 [Physocladia obscura]
MVSRFSTTLSVVGAGSSLRTLVTSGSELHPVLRALLRQSNNSDVNNNNDSSSSSIANINETSTDSKHTPNSREYNHDGNRLARLAGLSSADSTLAHEDIASLIKWVEPITRVNTTTVDPLVSFPADTSVAFDDLADLAYRTADSWNKDTDPKGRDLLLFSKNADHTTGLFIAKIMKT